MILSTWKGNRYINGEMQPYQTWKLAYIDWHREYPLDTAEFETKINKKPSYGFRCGVMFDPSQLEDLGVPEEEIESLMAHFPEELRDGSSGSYTVVYVDGVKDQLTKLFELYAVTFFDSELGGDDQTYDYWPNSFDMILRPLAKDLDTIYEHTEPIFENRVKEMYLEFIKKYGPVPEFHFDDKNPMPEEEEDE